MRCRLKCTTKTPGCFFRATSLTGSDCTPPAWTDNLLVALKSCGRIRDPDTARMLHACALEHGQVVSIYVGNGLLNMYGKCGTVLDAWTVFRKLPAHDLVSYNLLIDVYAEGGQELAALKLYADVRSEANARTFVAALKACTALAVKEQAGSVQGKLVKVESLQRGIAVHGEVDRSCCGWDIYLKNTLLDFYAKCGAMVEARRVFDDMQQGDVVSWNVLLAGYAENGEAELALHAFFGMQSGSCTPNALTFVAVLKACVAVATGEEGKVFEGKLVKTRTLETGMRVHLRALECCCDREIMVASCLINMYSRSGSMADARRVFDKVPDHDLVLWNGLLLGYVENGEEQLALDLFHRMNVTGCSVTLVAALKACTGLAEKEMAKPAPDGKLLKLETLKKATDVLHAADSFDESEPFVSSTLLNMYAKCGCMAESRRTFDRRPFHSVASCNALMLGYVENGEEEAALEIFAGMERENKAPDALTFIAALKACCGMMALEVAKAIHGRMCAAGQEVSTIAACLLDAYGKCGSVLDAQEFFDSLVKRDSVTWTALMAGYSRQGDAQQVFVIFKEMVEEGVAVDGVTFNCILNACAHAGLVDRGRQVFDLMKTPRFGIKPDVEHYTCLIDMLGRSNEIEEALRVVRTMPFQANCFTWMTLLSSCRKWRNVKVGKLAFEWLIQNDSRDSAAYILMSSIYGAAGEWEEQLKVESMRRGARAWKKPGRSSWTDHTGAVHSFTVGDSSHPQSGEIHSRLKQVMNRIKTQEGYEADAGSVTQNIIEREKEDALCGHSEKLAIVCALINSAPRSTIRIMKNLRSCEDCHKFAEMISRAEQRVIVCRDVNRFHVFSDGRCSCGGFW